MASDVKVRVLQSGKVYRQMFDAEVQLVKSLQFTTSKRQTNDNQLPILKNNTGKHTTGLLSERQKLWTRGMPNDSITENPVAYRQLTAEYAEQFVEREQDVNARYVRGLPEVVPHVSSRTDISERIMKKRKARHDESVLNMHKELSEVSNKIEPKVVEIGQNLLEILKENDEKIEEFFRPITIEEELINYAHEQLEELWFKIEKQSALRKSWVQEADVEFQKLEGKRIQAIGIIFRKHTALLEKIAYLLFDDLERFIEKESMMVNQSVLANRRAFTKLNLNLLESDVHREMVQRLTWQEKVQDWKVLNAQAAVEQFKNYMDSEKVKNPFNITEIIQQHLNEQNELSLKRLEILQQLDNFKPPLSTKTAVYKWNTALAKANENIDHLHLKLLQVINMKYENICQQCLAEIDKYRKNLVLSKVCTEEDIQRIVNDHMLPLVGNQQKIFERNLEKLDQAVESYAMQCETQLKSMFKFAQGAAHLWDVHEIALAKQERNLQSTLDHTRQQHDLENQERESKLDVIMDRLRQESTEEVLATCLQKALDMLGIIFEGYKQFHTDQLKFVQGYPTIVEEELSNYDRSVCHFFNVDRNQPLPPPTTLPPPPTSPLISSNISSPVLESSVAMVSSLEEEDPVRILRDTLVTEKGTLFYVITKANKEDFEDDDVNDMRNSQIIFMTEVEDMDPMLKSIVEKVYIKNSFFKDIKKRIRMSFLNQLEEWKERSMAVAGMWKRDKVDEFESELDLRIHLHDPRAKRIELDVHNVRAAELVLHKERVSRHCRGITAALLGLKEDFDELTKEHDELSSVFKSSIVSMEEVFSNSTKSTKLVSLIESLHDELDEHMINIKASLRNFRQKLDMTLSRLRDSNAQCLKSFKLFSQGGNFSPEETVNLRKKLEKMSQKVDYGEGLIMQDLEGMESKRLDQATDFISKFEDKFRNHMMDLIFMEKIQRWITNSQVRIKTEVAHCNGEAQQINAHVQTMYNRIDACKRPNIDKETVTTELLQQYLLEVMDVLHDRASYLNCKKKAVQSPSIEPATSRISVSEPSNTNLQPTSSVHLKGHRGGRTKSLRDTSGVATAPSRSDVQVGGKRVQQEDVAIGMIKSILRTQKMSSSTLDVDEVRPMTTRNAPSVIGSQVGISGRPQKGNLQTPGNAGSTSEFDKNRRVSQSGRVGSGVYKKRETKFEAKYMTFGTSPPREKHFVAKVQLILYETLDGLLSIGELYYKQKGSRAPTRPNHIQENFDLYAEKVNEKLQKYQEQTNDFWNTSLQEFRHQLKDMEEHVAEIPGLKLGEVQNKWLDTLHNSTKKLNIVFSKQEKIWNNIKDDHKEGLRPTMGHPNREETLQKLIDDEKSRMDENNKGVQEHKIKLCENANDYVAKVSQDMYETSKVLLRQFENLLTIDDVITGKIPIKRERTSVLLRQKAAGEDILHPTYTTVHPRGANTWPGLDISIFEMEAPIPDVMESISTSHTTLAHTSTVEMRDKMLQTFADTYHRMLTNIAEEESVRLHSEERWAKNWKNSVDHVRSLYK